jgi:hypothetical protein
MKKIIVCCLLLCCCALVKAQTRPDTLSNKPKQPMFMPNVGYSLFEGKYFKAGTWIRLHDIVNFEIDYSLYPNSPYNHNIHKVFAGLNVFPFKEKSFFLSFSTSLLQIYMMRLSVPFKHEYYDKRAINILSDKNGAKFSICAGNKFDFGANKKCGVYIKYGLMTPVKVGNGPWALNGFIFNMECAFFINLKNHKK